MTPFPAAKEIERFRDVIHRLEVLERNVSNYLSALRRAGIRKAWNRERDLLSKNLPGSRNWTKEQKAAILRGETPKGPNGLPIEGHHVKTVDDFPELADDPKNIVFKTFEEHRGPGGIHRPNAPPGSP